MRQAKAQKGEEPSSGSGYRWETETRNPVRWGDDEAEDIDKGRQAFEGMSPSECGQEFYRMLLSLKGSKLSAKEASLLAFWACGAGAEGEARALAYPPNRGTGHYSEHWDKALGGRPTDDVYHHVTSPVFHRYDATIDQLELPTIPAVLFQFIRAVDHN